MSGPWGPETMMSPLSVSQPQKGNLVPILSLYPRYAGPTHHYMSWDSSVHLDLQNPPLVL